jgi:hypothetical protein
MKKATVKKTLIWSASILLFFVLVLAVHIYVVTRPKTISPYSRTMARIDLHQPVTQLQADSIKAWMNGQKGVIDSYISVKSDKAIFLFYTTRTTGNQVVKDFKDQFRFDNAVRFLPAAADYEKSCPIVAVAYTEKIARFFRHIF